MRRVLLALGCLALTSTAWGYIEVPHSFGQLIAQSSNIVLMRVEQVDKSNNIIIYRKVQDVKGVYPQEVIKHNIGRGGLRPNEWKPPIEWAEPGKIACFFLNGGASETCIGTWWYQAYAGGEWWNHSHGEPYLLRSYAGPPERLPGLVTAVMEGKEVIVPCMADGNKEELHNRTARIQRLKASLKLQNYDQKRDFVGYGGEEFRRVLGMPGFTHITALPRTDPDAQSISTIDFDSDGKLDLCLAGGGRVLLLQNNGDSMGELTLPGVTTARSVVWGDYNSDGLPDVLAVTASGPKLFTNLGKAQFRNDSHLLPPEPYTQLTAAAWADVDGDGRADLILANGYHGLRVYRNLGMTVPPIPAPVRWGPWSYLGPVDYDQQKGFEFPHPAEQLDLKAEYVGKNKTKIRWKVGEFSDEAVNNLLGLFPENLRTWVGIYLHRTIDVKSDVTLPLSFGSDDTLTVWIDGKKIVSDPNHRACAPDQNQVRVQLTAGKHDLLIKVCQGDGDFGFYFKRPTYERPIPQGQAFEDISRQVGFGDGIASDAKSDSLVVCDVNGDGRPDFLYGKQLFLNREEEQGLKFTPVSDSGLNFDPARAGPIFADFDNDGRVDLFVPQRQACRLFRGDGAGRFKDITAGTGDLAKFAGWATSAACGDLDNDGHLDLVVGCFKGTNRVFRGDGKGSFSEGTSAFGLNQRIFNSQSVACVDVNADGQLDLIFNNEGQESCLLLGSGGLAAGKRVPLTLRVQSKLGATSSQARLIDKAGTPIAQAFHGSDGRGSQQTGAFRFAVPSGAYELQLRLSDGRVISRTVEVGDSAARVVIGDEP